MPGARAGFLPPGFSSGNPIARFQAALGIASPAHAGGVQSTDVQNNEIRNRMTSNVCFRTCADINPPLLEPETPSDCMLENRYSTRQYRRSQQDGTHRRPAWFPRKTAKFVSCRIPFIFSSVFW